MRKAYSNQRRLDCDSVLNVKLNLYCRDEIVPIPRALQHVYADPDLRQEILDLVAQDVNHISRADRGREGMEYWQVLVSAAVRLGCNLDYDKLQDLAEQHRALRQIMGIGDWDQKTDFNWRRIRDNVCLLQPGTIERISHLALRDGGSTRTCSRRSNRRHDESVASVLVRVGTTSSVCNSSIAYCWIGWTD